MEPLVSCILLNWNGWPDTIACLLALRNLEYSNLSIIVVDNASTDNSVQHIRQAFPEILLIQNDSNAGFAAGNNLGIQRGLQDGADFVWLLNNDTEPAHDALSAMLRVAQQNRRIGAVGSVLSYYHDPSIVQAWGGGRTNVWLGMTYTNTVAKPDTWFDYLTAASLLLRREAIQDIGLMDDSFFLYWEDVEYSFRLRRKGWILAVATDSHILHKENASTGGISKALDYFSTDTGARFLRKYAPVPALSVAAFVARRVLFRLLRMQFSSVSAVLSGWRASRRPERMDPATLQRL
jgi:GT2 family glycosyltransferase